MNIELLISEFETAIKEIEKIYLELPDEYFFTEKELHSYFYHICLSNSSFTIKSRLNLIHTEYPTPFKCSLEKTHPYFKIQNTNSEYIRSHIDLVLLNPNFIEWLSKFKNPYDYIRGLRNELFSKYIKDFISKYEQFYKETKENILLYALEFKYFRIGYEGAKYPIISIAQDVEKLKNIKSFKLDFMKNELPFSNKILSLVFIGDKNKKIIKEYGIDKYCKENTDVIRLITKI